MTHLKEIKHKMKYIPVHFNFKTKKVEFGEVRVFISELLKSSYWRYY